MPKETFPGERRVALIPDIVPALLKQDHEVAVQAGAGMGAGITDAMFEAKGAKIVAERSELFSSAEVILQVRSLGANPEAGKADLDL
ncbi:MAG: NAD(P)(+) transhydrogenase (Re/Si-specific) subunit alpha, partial [Planctomycetes bacterium]|nr:NAD(P)(+) transhydrogenase (Re/Si-specific) subunit alpha [Planctomycetota bacterium]